MISIGASAETLTGMVVGVADGDTISVLDANREQHKIRVAGIDPPEKAQPFGQRSKESLSAMVFGKEVEVQWHKHDRYQGIVGKVTVQPSGCPTCPKTLDAGLAQLTVGLAWWYQKYAKEQSPEDAGGTSLPNRKRGESTLAFGPTVIRYRRGSGGRANADGVKAVADDDRRSGRRGDRRPL